MMAKPVKKPFSEMAVTVTMSGAEWAMIIGKMLQQPLSDRGYAVYAVASRKLHEQILAAQADAK